MCIGLLHASSKARYEKIYTLIQDSRPTATASRNIAGLVPVEISTSVQQYLSDSVVSGTSILSVSFRTRDNRVKKTTFCNGSSQRMWGYAKKNSGI